MTFAAAAAAQITRSDVTVLEDGVRRGLAHVSAGTAVLVIGLEVDTIDPTARVRTCGADCLSVHTLRNGIPANATVVDAGHDIVAVGLETPLARKERHAAGPF